MMARNCNISHEVTKPRRWNVVKMVQNLRTNIFAIWQLEIVPHLVGQILWLYVSAITDISFVSSCLSVSLRKNYD